MTKAITHGIGTIEDFYDLVHDEFEAAIRDESHRLWLAFCDEQGDWLAVRYRAEEDPTIPGDIGRPVGPVAVERIPMPWLVSFLEQHPDVR